jgi:hypothetical protein
MRSGGREGEEKGEVEEKEENIQHQNYVRTLGLFGSFAAPSPWRKRWWQQGTPSQKSPPPAEFLIPLHA